MDEIQEEVATSEDAIETPEVATEEPQGEPTASVEGDGTAQATPAPDPHKQTAQERINELTRLRRDAEREREYWKREALKEKVQEPAQAAPPLADTSGIPTRPSISNFESQEDYEDALIDWGHKKTALETENKRKQIEMQEVLTSFNRKAQALRKEYADFDDVIEAPVFTPFMRNALLKSENGPEIAYYLGRPENREAADKIRQQPPEQQIYELGKLEMNLLLTKQTKKTTSAPEPIKPIGMAGGGKVDPDKMSDQEWYEYEKKRQKQKLTEKYGG